MSYIKHKQIKKIQYPLIFEKSGSDLLNGYTGYGVGSDSNTSGYHFKIDKPMYVGQSGKFIKLYRDGVELVYNTDWIEGKSIYPNCPDLVPSLRLNISQYNSGSTYRLEYYEYTDWYIPTLTLYRTDDYPLINKLITPRIYFNDGIDEWAGVINTITNTNLSGSDSRFSYVVNYIDTSNTYSHDVNKTFGTHLSVREYDIGQPFPSGIRMEIWNKGNSRGRGTTTGGNNRLNPFITLTSNVWDGLWSTIDSGYRLYGKVLIRDINNNIVSQFSSESLILRKKKVFQEGYYGDSYIGEYYISRLRY